MEELNESSLAMELVQGMKKTVRNQRILIVILVILLTTTNVYHTYQWSKFDAVVVDSGDGGNAGYVGNDGDVNNYGESSSTQTEEKQ